MSINAQTPHEGTSADTLDTSSLPGRAGESISPLLIGAIILTMFMAVLDQTIVGTALPRIASDIDGAHLYTWVVTSYLLTSTVFVPIFGTLSDRYGHKKLLLFGICLFAIASIACGLSQTAQILVASRFIQGIGAAVLVTVPLALILDRSPREKAVQIQSAFGSIIALSLLIGPYLGGVISDHLSWHWIFFINVPIAIIVLVVVILTLDESTQNAQSQRNRVDWIGFLVFSAGVGAMLIGLSNKGGREGSPPLAWSDPTVWPLIIGGIAGIAVFIYIEHQVSNPLIPVKTLRQGKMHPTLVASFAVAFLMYPAIIFVPRYYQSALNTSATESALRAFPLMFGLVVGMIALGVIVKLTGKYKIPLLFFSGVSICGLVLLRSLPDEPAGITYVGLALLGIGIGPMISGLMMVGQNSLHQSNVGLATSSVTFFRQIGGTVALAFAGSIFATGIEDSMAEGGSTAEAVASSVSDVVAMLGAIGVAIVLLCVFFLPSVTLTDEHPAPKESDNDTGTN